MGHPRSSYKVLRLIPSIVIFIFFWCLTTYYTFLIFSFTRHGKEHIFVLVPYKVINLNKGVKKILMESFIIRLSLFSQHFVQNIYWEQVFLTLVM